MTDNMDNWRDQNMSNRDGRLSQIVWKRPAGSGEFYLLTSSLVVREGQSWSMGMNGCETYQPSRTSVNLPAGTRLWVMHTYWASSRPPFKMVLAEILGNTRTYSMAESDLLGACRVPDKAQPDLYRIEMTEELTGLADNTASMKMYQEVEEIHHKLQEMEALAEEHGWHHCQFALEQASDWVQRIRWVTQKLGQKVDPKDSEPDEKEDAYYRDYLQDRG